MTHWNCVTCKRKEKANKQNNNQTISSPCFIYEGSLLAEVSPLLAGKYEGFFFTVNSKENVPIFVFLQTKIR